MKEEVLLPWGINYCKCGKIKTSHTPFCRDCIEIINRRKKLEKLLSIIKRNE